MPYDGSTLFAHFLFFCHSSELLAVRLLVAAEYFATNRFRLYVYFFGRLSLASREHLPSTHLRRYAVLYGPRSLYVCFGLGIVIIVAVLVGFPPATPI